MKKDPDVPSCEQPLRERRFRWTWWISLVVRTAVYVTAAPYRPSAHLFGFVAFEERYDASIEVVLFCLVELALRATYLLLFRACRLAEYEATKAQLRQGQLKRMPFAVRAAFLLCMLALVSLGWYAHEPYGSRILAVAVPLFLLFAAAEFGAILQPGDSLLPDPHDELLQFFRTRMLQTGYVTAILALIGLYLLSLWGPRYLGLLLPFVLTLSLLTPAFMYNRLNRQAGPDE